MKNDVTHRDVELRLALICYGGVSLAVYMHGVTKELHKLVRASRCFDSVVDQLLPPILSRMKTEPTRNIGILRLCVSLPSAAGVCR